MILRTVEYGVFTRVGGTQEIRSTARIIAATNADLTAKMEAGEFLRDLYDRLAFEVIHVSSLRERESDVELLAHRFLTRFMREIPRPVVSSVPVLLPEVLTVMRREPAAPLRALAPPS